MSSFIDHTLLQFAFSSVESLSIVQTKMNWLLVAVEYFVEALHDCADLSGNLWERV